MKLISIRNYKSHRLYSQLASKPVVMNSDSEMNQSHVNLADMITIVNDKASANRVISIMKSYDNDNRFWACDTEVADIDVSSVSPVGNGKVTCISIYGGPDVDFGRGSGGVLWVDNLQEADGTLLAFKEWFENQSIKKIWHNYGFDRHVMYNENIDCQGFAGDTMHMARVWDTSRDKLSGGGGYSLESLTESLLAEKDISFRKVSMKELFGVAKKLKDGSDSKIKDLPEIRELQLNPVYRENWIEYSARDAVATWYVAKIIQSKLLEMPWIVIDNGKDITLG